ncbi:MAG: calcium-binding protein [Geminicoccaceae bacterium]|nr:calcium-binding protein [Geminicoccaceae bacterium]
MARLDVLSGAFDNAREPLRGLRRTEITSVTPTEVVATRGPSVFTITGTGFVQNPQGEFVAGTVTGIAERQRGVLLYTLTELDVPAADLQRFVVRNRVKDFLDAVYGDEDVLNGGTGNDRLAGFAGEDELNGNAGNDTLEGGDGDDRLDGGTGVDRMSGGAGNDTYLVDNARDRVSEARGGGTDTVEASTSFTIPQNVEVLRLTGTAALDATGSNGAERLEGNSGANTLDGRGGNDVLAGGGGADTLLGGRGADRFVIDSLAGGVDTIRDFRTREGDVLDLSELITSFDGTPANHVRLSGSGGVVQVEVDTDGGGNSFTPAVTVRGDIGLDVNSLVAAGTIVLT